MKTHCRRHTKSRILWSGSFYRAARRLFFFRALVAVLASLTLSGTASAGVVDVLREIDYRKLGDNLITLDTISGRRWLDLTESVGLSYNDMVGPLNDCNPRCTKGQFRGWTFADENAVLGLLGDVNLGYDFAISGTEQLANLLVFILTLGPTLNLSQPNDILVVAAGATRTLTGGVSADGVPTVIEPTAEYIACCDSFSSWELPFQETSEHLAIDDSNSAVPHGIWLFRDVPEPSILSLSIAGLLAMLVAKRQKR